jgi:hypothetical protein
MLRILALGATFLVWSMPIAGQKAKPSNQVEPLRVINGEMRGKLISGSISLKPAAFSFAIEKATVVGNQLQLSGTFWLGSPSSRRYPVSAKLAGTMARAANPWPSANNNPPRRNPERETKRPTQDVEGERTEQTQSLYVQAVKGNGCEILFLSLRLPPPLRAALGAGNQALQLGVVLEEFDNQLGEEINKRICQLFKALKLKPDGEEVSKYLDQLNRLLASSK